jgi:hypothetical protein
MFAGHSHELGSKSRPEGRRSSPAADHTQGEFQTADRRTAIGYVSILIEGLLRAAIRRIVSEELKNRLWPGPMERKTGFEPATLTLAIC